MGQGATLKIYNATPIAMNQSSKHDYQMNDWSPPSSIDANTAGQFYVEYAQPFFSFQDPGDDGADVHYDLGSTTQKLWFMARAKDVPMGNSYTTNFWLQFQSDWDHNVTAPTKEPFYMFSATGSTTWTLLSSDILQIGAAVGDNPLLEFRIVQVDQFCANETETIKIGTALMNGDQNTPEFQAFLSRVNEKLNSM